MWRDCKGKSRLMAIMIMFLSSDQEECPARWKRCLSRKYRGKQEEVEKKISVDKCIQLTRDLIAGLRQKDTW